MRRMPPWWKYQADLPNPEGRYTGVVREIDAQDHNIWLLQSGVIRRYGLDNGALVDYRMTGSGQEITWAKHMLVSQDETVWAIVRLDISFVLMKFDDETDSFRFVQDQDHLFSNWEGVQPTAFRSNIAETPDGEILIPFQNNIYQYAPDKNIAQLLLPTSFEFMINSIAVSERNVWFTVVEAADLWHLDLSTKKLTNYGHVLDDYEGPIGVDDMGRVWTGYAARLDPVESDQYQWWQPETFPLEFIYIVDRNLDSLSGRNNYELIWASVLAVETVSDGNVWFSTSSGVVKYDIHKDDWCLSAPGSPHSFSEDNDGNLWMALGGYSRYQGIYKYKLRP